MTLRLFAVSQAGRTVAPVVVPAHSRLSARARVSENACIPQRYLEVRDVEIGVFCTFRCGDVRVDLARPVDGKSWYAYAVWRGNRQYAENLGFSDPELAARHFLSRLVDSEDVIDEDLLYEAGSESLALRAEPSR